MADDTANTSADLKAPSSNTSTQAQVHLRQKRARSQLSCTPCRTGKLKCNRQHPHCDQCIKRSRETQCIFIPPPPRNKPTQNVKGRIRQLETLVVDLMNQQKSTGPSAEGTSTGRGSSGGGRSGSGAAVNDQPTPPSDLEESPQGSEESQKADNLPELGVERPFGQMKVSKDEISYHGASHWQTILNSISDLRRDLGDEEEAADVDEDDRSPESYWGANSKPVMPGPTSGLGFMLGHNPGAANSKEELLKAVPEKRVADRLLSMWFNSPDPFKPCIHAPTFQNEYRRFWQNPSDAPVMWLGLLFGILSIAESFGLRGGAPDDPKSAACAARATRYHSMAASAAVLGDFTKPKQYTLECLVVYGAGMRSSNAFLNVWLMIGLILRLALRMGYHRDASAYGNITPFQGEMRRRVWSLISMIDVLISFQLGLPSLVRTLAADTEPPRNLLDRDFGKDTKVLPPGRPIEELTPSSYTRAKVGLVHIFAQATELSHATALVSHDEVMQLDGGLEAAKAAIPPLLQMPEFHELVTDPAEQLMCRFNLELLYLKTKIVLHRRYMLVPLHELSIEEQTRGIGHSRLLCVNSSIKVLKHHHTIYAASQAGGQLDSVKWYMGSISTHDFLLAAMVICLELSQQMREDRMIFLSNGQMCPRRQDMINSLEQSQKIWSGAAPRHVAASGGALGVADVYSKSERMFSETEKAAKAMAVMLERVKAHFEAQPLADPVVSKACVDAAQAGVAASSSGAASEHSWAMPAENAFQGLVSNVDWSGDLPTNGAFTGPSTGDYTQGTDTSYVTANLSIDASDGANIPIDYSNIGDMLDLPVNMDWDHWDDTVMRTDAPVNTGRGADAFAGQSSAYSSMANGYSNGIVPDGTNALSFVENGMNASNGFNELDLRWEDMQSVDLDIRDYGSGGLWGKSPSWQQR
ncbi:hypothetical protein B0A48_11690 [Cryoendolithus antarcticus]|uniref:Zn(2)-C6 fungal-type domain-containing protein n=1 Tax=Cryoendolithus antarcticus TaxID=1507870 RepID=A0A1V8SSZ9_9PEZI|nr:hypothetical protein B0A48_11690 [Cryoendolithus antarcticus]